MPAAERARNSRRFTLFVLDLTLFRQFGTGTVAQNGAACLS